jgi:glucosamine--fructose-6-phosphate aminotransferase (isomerizing)
MLDAHGRPVQRAPLQILWDPIHAEKGGFEHFMQKEIHEQPRAITQTIGTRAIEEAGDVDLDGIDLGKDWARELRNVQIVGCGTASYAGMLGRDLIERFAHVQTQVDLAHEFRYREPLLTPKHLMIPISQSGETADTLGALRMGRECGAKTLSITNTHGSTIARESDYVLYTHAGPEIGVASTKCFSAQVTALYLLGLKLGLLREVISPPQARAAIVELRRLPRQVDEAIARWGSVEKVARLFYHCSDFLFLGRGVGYPVALEGALKLKEISYIHAEGYASGEIKHGPIALIQEGTPVVVVANQPSARSKLISTAEEVRARGARVIAVAEDGDEEIARHADHVLYVPPTPEPLCSVVATVPLQILAYQIAKLRGTDVDQPRNLAKSVTVE